MKNYLAPQINVIYVNLATDVLTASSDVNSTYDNIGGWQTGWEVN